MFVKINHFSRFIILLLFANVRQKIEKGENGKPDKRRKKNVL